MDIKREKLSQLGLQEEEIEDLLLKAKHSAGIPFESSEMDFLKNLANDILNLKTRINEVDALLGYDVARIAPNLTALAGNHLSAELLAAAGGLMCLAKLQANKLQVLGQKRFPNIGVISRHPALRFCHPKIRLSVAQTFTRSIVACVRVDAFRNARKDERLLSRQKKLIEESLQAPPPTKALQNGRMKTESTKQNGKTGSQLMKLPPTTFAVDATIILTTIAVGSYFYHLFQKS